MPDNGPATITVIREAERPVVDFVGGATYRPIVGDDTGEGLPIRTGIQTSPPGYATRVPSHPYVETLTVISGRGEAWLDGEAEKVILEPGVTVVLPANRPHIFRVVGDQPLEALAIHGGCARLAQIAVDHHDPFHGPAQCHSVLPEIVLTSRALGVFDNLPERGLPDI